MSKTLILVGVLVAVLVGIAVFVNRTMMARIEVPEESPTTSLNTPVTKTTDVSQYDFLEQRYVRILEASLSAINKRIDELAKKQTTVSTVNPNVYTVVTASTAPAASTTTSNIKTLYIPMGYGGSSSATSDFESISSTEISINPNDYPGYKKMVFEANFRIFQGNGTGEARILNKTDGTAVLASSVSTNSQDYSTKTSNGFTLPGGSKTYVVQLKSTTGYSVDLQLTRIRVDF